MANGRIFPESTWSFQLVTNAVSRSICTILTLKSILHIWKRNHNISTQVSFSQQMVCSASEPLFILFSLPVMLFPFTTCLNLYHSARSSFTFLINFMTWHLLLTTSLGNDLYTTLIFTNESPVYSRKWKNSVLKNYNSYIINKRSHGYLENEYWLENSNNVMVANVWCVFTMCNFLNCSFNYDSGTVIMYILQMRTLRG